MMTSVALGVSRTVVGVVLLIVVLHNCSCPSCTSNGSNSSSRANLSSQPRLGGFLPVRMLARLVEVVRLAAKYVSISVGPLGPRLSFNCMVVVVPLVTVTVVIAPVMLVHFFARWSTGETRCSTSNC